MRKEKKNITFGFKPMKIITQTNWDKFVEMVDKEEKESKATEAKRVVTYVAVIQEYVIS